VRSRLVPSGHRDSDKDENMRTATAANKKSGRPATFTVVRSGIPFTVTTTWPAQKLNCFFEA